MNKILLFILCGLTVPCYAQDPADVPAGNPVQFPTGPAQWTIGVSYKGDPSVTPTPAKTEGQDKTTGAIHIRTIEVTQSEGLQRTTITWGNGRKTDKWYVTASQSTISTDTTDGSPAFFSSSNKLMQSAFATGFEPTAFVWLKRENFINTVSYKGQPCLHYKATLDLGRTRQLVAGGASYPTGTFEAWIDKATFRPIAFSDGTKTGVYAFAKDPPTDPLVMPKAVDETYKDNTIPLIPPKN